MRYIISDIHGCYEEYMELLEKIGFSEEDQLYVLGDAMDRGPEPIKVIKDIMKRPNVVYIIGNHDYVMLQVMKKLITVIKEDNYRNQLSEGDLWLYSLWMQEDGGEITSRQFVPLPEKERKEILAYLEKGHTYEVVEDQGRKFILVHAGINSFAEDKELSEYELYDFISGRPDYDKRYYEDENTYIVTGHTPTFYINPGWNTDVYQGNGHIALDCGCVFGGKLAAYCIETGEITYVLSRNRMDLLVKAENYNETSILLTFESGEQRVLDLNHLLNISGAPHLSDAIKQRWKIMFDNGDFFKYEILSGDLVFGGWVEIFAKDLKKQTISLDVYKHFEARNWSRY